MKCYLAESKSEREVILEENGKAKVYDCFPSGVFDYININSKNAEENLNEYFYEEKIQYGELNKHEQDFETVANSVDKLTLVFDSANLENNIFLSVERIDKYWDDSVVASVRLNPDKIDEVLKEKGRKIDEYKFNENDFFASVDYSLTEKSGTLFTEEGLGENIYYLDDLGLERYMYQKISPEEIREVFKMIEEGMENPEILNDFTNGEEKPEEDMEIESALSLISKFFEEEYGECDMPFDDLSNIGLAYTTMLSEELHLEGSLEHELQVSVDLNNFKMKYEIDGKKVYEKQYESLEELSKMELECLDYEALIYDIPDEYLVKFANKQNQKSKKEIELD